jgi:hypothetical protein
MLTKIRLLVISLALAAPMALPAVSHAGFRFP